MDFTNILNMSCNSSPAKPVSDIEFSTPTPTKLKNLTESDIEKLSDEDSLELAMRQSMKENKSVRRAIDMSPFGMSEDDQVVMNSGHKLCSGLVQYSNGEIVSDSLIVHFHAMI
jgi:hypothetical protein